MKKFLKWFLIIVVGFYAFILTWGHFTYTKPANEVKKVCSSYESDITFGNGGAYLTGPYDKCAAKIVGCDYGYSKKFEGCCYEDNYACEVCRYNALDCTDFDDQIYAQETYFICEDFWDHTNDIHELDADGDGIACESLIPIPPVVD